MVILQGYKKFDNTYVSYFGSLVDRCFLWGFLTDIYKVAAQHVKGPLCNVIVLLPANAKLKFDNGHKMKGYFD